MVVVCEYVVTIVSCVSMFVHVHLHAVLFGAELVLNCAVGCLCMLFCCVYVCLSAPLTALDSHERCVYLAVPIATLTG